MNTVLMEKHTPKEKVSPISMRGLNDRVRKRVVELFRDIDGWACVVLHEDYHIYGMGEWREPTKQQLFRQIRRAWKYGTWH